MDFMYSGTVQHINAEKIKRRVAEEVVQLSCIGYRCDSFHSVVCYINIYLAAAVVPLVPQGKRIEFKRRTWPHCVLNSLEQLS